ncbi:unnamed protein product [Prunus brigantina]
MSSSSFTSSYINQEDNGVQMEKNDDEAASEEPELENRENVQEPRVGMTFNNIDEIVVYYREYGKQLGFPVRKRTSQKGDEGELKYVTISCGREGKYKSKSSNVLKPHPSIKTGCKARVRAGILLDGRWQINSIKLDHNHDMSPTKARYFRCHRTISSDMKRRIELNDRAGIRLNKSYNSLVVEVGGHENISFLEKDCRNYIENVRRLRLGEGDATAIQTYFLNMQAQNSNFFYAIDLDQDGRLRNVFWADARSRAAYEEFGDVVTFDTTYLTNKYDMPFAPFVGVNHHGQSILLGCGLISSEDTNAFIWLFKSWLACMHEHAPRGIITDQDKAMKNAIEIIFPNTRHRWCLWHIMNKFPSKLNRYNQYESIMYALQSTVYGSLEKVEFEEGWGEIIEKYELQDNEWLAGLYNERQRWVPCFVKDSFWAGMSTTQRSESMNAFFDDHVNSKTTLKQFVEQYENALKVKVQKEKQEDFKSSSIGFDCGTHYNMEKQAQEVYTISKYKEFHDELIGKMYCDYVSHKVNAANFEYQISEDFMMEGKKKRLYFKVWLNEDDNEVRCNCRMFEFRGILCRHTIYVFLRHNIDLIPEKYIMRRWRKDVKRCHTRIEINYESCSLTPEAQRCHKMQKAFDEIKELANDSDNKCMIVMTWVDNSPIGRNTENDVSSIPNPSQHILTPLAARKKGRPPFKRRKSQLEQAVRKKQDSKKKKQESNKKIKSCGNNTNGEKELNVCN